MKKQFVERKFMELPEVLLTEIYKYLDRRSAKIMMQTCKTNYRLFNTCLDLMCKSKISFSNWDTNLIFANSNRNFGDLTFGFGLLDEEDPSEISSDETENEEMDEIDVESIANDAAAIEEYLEAGSIENSLYSTLNSDRFFLKNLKLCVEHDFVNYLPLFEEAQTLERVEVLVCTSAQHTSFEIDSNLPALKHLKFAEMFFADFEDEEEDQEESQNSELLSGLLTNFTSLTILEIFGDLSYLKVNLDQLLNLNLKQLKLNSVYIQSSSRDKNFLQNSFQLSNLHIENIDYVDAISRINYVRWICTQRSIKKFVLGHHRGEDVRCENALRNVVRHLSRLATLNSINLNVDINTVNHFYVPQFVNPNVKELDICGEESTYMSFRFLSQLFPNVRKLKFWSDLPIINDFTNVHFFTQIEEFFVDKTTAQYISKIKMPNLKKFTCTDEYDRIEPDVLFNFLKKHPNLEHLSILKKKGRGFRDTDDVEKLVWHIRKLRVLEIGAEFLAGTHLRSDLIRRVGNACGDLDIFWMDFDDKKLGQSCKNYLKGMLPFLRFHPTSREDYDYYTY